MNAHEPPPDARFAELLAAHDEALHGGSTADGAPEVPPEWRPRLERDLACLRLLRGVLRAGPTAPPEGGTRLGPFEVVRELGRGAHGVVFLAYDSRLGREVALKVPRPEALATPELRERFLREARAAAGLDHPNLVPVYEAGAAGAVCYIAAAYCPGPTLADWLRGAAPVPPGEAARLVLALAEAVQHAHERGVVHRDLKPSNVLLASGGLTPPVDPETGDSRPPLAGLAPKVTDFGLAKFLDAGETGRTDSGAIVGTPSYMAPEQAAGRPRQVGPAADVYALGAVLYELLTGRPPFRAETALDTVLQVLHEEPVRPRRLRPELPRDLETVCLKCLRKEPGKRYASAQGLAEDLRAFLEGRPVLARRVGGVERAWCWCRREPTAAGLLAAVALTLLLGAGVASFFAMRAEARRQVAETEKGRADEQAEEARRWALRATHRLYVSDLRLAQQRWEDSQVGRVLELLEGQRPERTNGIDLRGFEWFYWWQLCHAERLSLRGHAGPVSGVAFGPDGRRLASGSWDRTVKVWDARTGQELLSLKGPAFAAECVAFSPDGLRLAASFGNRQAPGEVRVWDAATGQELLALRHAGAAHNVAFGPDGRLASASGDGTVTIWDGRTGQALRTLTGHVGDVRGVAFSPDGRRLDTGAHDRTVKVWDAATGKEVLSLRGHTERVWSVAYSPDGRRLASSSQDRTVRVWDAATGQAERTLKGHTSYVWRVAFSPDGRHLASASDDMTVKVWDARTGQEVRTLKGHTGSVYGVAYGPGGRLASGSHDRTVKVWDGATDQAAPSFAGHAGRVWGVCFSPDGRRLASGSEDKTVKVWGAATGRELLSLAGHVGAVWDVAFGPDGRLASASGDRTVKVWDARTGQAVHTLQGHAASVLSVTYSPDGRRLASGSEDKTVKVWDALSGQPVRTLTGHAGPVWGVAYSPDGRRLAGASEDGAVRVWDAATGQELLTLQGHAGAAHRVCFSPDGGRLACACGDGAVRVWDARTGQALPPLLGHTGRVWGVSFSPDGSRLASSSQDRTVKVWDTATGQEVLSLKGNGVPVWGVAFGPDGRLLASGSDEGTIMMWPAGAPKGEEAPRE